MERTVEMKEQWRWKNSGDGKNSGDERTVEMEEQWRWKNSGDERTVEMESTVEMERTVVPSSETEALLLLSSQATGWTDMGFSERIYTI